MGRPGNEAKWTASEFTKVSGMYTSGSGIQAYPAMGDDVEQSIMEQWKKGIF